MKIFFEATPYHINTIKRYLGDKHSNSLVKHGSDNNSYTISGVGYCLDCTNLEHVFVLPKNFVMNGKGFGCIDLSQSSPIEDNEYFDSIITTYGWERDILTKLPIYIYHALDKYRRQLPSQTIIESDETINVYSSKSGKSETTLLDITLSLQKFYSENQNLFVMIYKQSHSGYNKVKWDKTVAKELPIIVGDNIIYPYIINRKKEINFEEELLVIFFNTLRYINNTFHFNIPIEQPYQLGREVEFSHKMSRGIILKRLKAIKNNYFNEKLIKLWHLLYLFNSKLLSIQKSSYNSDYLFVRHFEQAFEKMIDTIISDSDSPNILINQADGKQVDHLFKGKSVVSNDLDIYYIGDSKYYATEKRPQYEALFKQYTYAKNIIQTEIDWLNNDSHTCLKYRDSITEGYNITPNFFISGRILPEWNYSDDHLTSIPHAFQKSIHYPNRIFDRDTLFLMQYDINILFIINLYVSRCEKQRQLFKNKLKISLRKEFTRLLNSKYDFYLITPQNTEGTDTLLNNFFRILNGKIFSPYDRNDSRFGKFILGLEKVFKQENVELINSIQPFFDIKKYSLGEEPSDTTNCTT